MNILKALTFIHPSIQQTTHSSVHPFIYSSTHPSIHLSFHPPIYSSTHLSNHLSIHPLIHYSSSHPFSQPIIQRTLCVFVLVTATQCWRFGHPGGDRLPEWHGHPAYLQCENNGDQVLLLCVCCRLRHAGGTWGANDTPGVWPLYLFFIYLLIWLTFYTVLKNISFVLYTRETSIMMAGNLALLVGKPQPSAGYCKSFSHTEHELELNSQGYD